VEDKMFIKDLKHRLFYLRRRGREMRPMWKIKCLLKICCTAPSLPGEGEGG
jgi:hypothetical protein